jgi:hypothetical protein
MYGTNTSQSSLGFFNGTSPSNTDLQQNCGSVNLGFDNSIDFHTYDLIWAPNSLTWQVDGVTKCTKTQNVPSHPMFVIANLAIKPITGAIDNSAFPQSLQVDYIRVSDSTSITIPTSTPIATNSPTPINTSTPTNIPTSTPTQPTATILPTQSGVVPGLTGTYFDNSDFTGTSVVRNDPNIDFAWGTGRPHPSIGEDTFSVRWEGNILVPTTGEYTFYATSDDGTRLWVNNTNLVDAWVDRGTTESSGKITLEGGKSYPIKMEYYDNGGDALAILGWSGPSLAKQTIRADRFTTGTQSPVATLTPTSFVPTSTPKPTVAPTISVPTPTLTPGATQILGYNTVGSKVDTGDSNYMNGSRFTTKTTSGTVSSMSVYVSSIASAPNNSYQLAIYSDESGVPGSLIASSATGKLTANSWNTLPITAALSPNTSYWLMYNTNGITVKNNNMKYSSGGIDAYSSVGVNFGTWPQKFGPSVKGSSKRSIYATLR